MRPPFLHRGANYGMMGANMKKGGRSLERNTYPYFRFFHSDRWNGAGGYHCFAAGIPGAGADYSGALCHQLTWLLEGAGNLGAHCL